MKTEKLFQIIKKLSKKEKMAFSKFIGNGKKPQYFLIYDRLLKQQSLNERSIREPEFQSSSKFSQYKVLVASKIVESLVRIREDSDSVKGYIDQALLIGADELARDRFTKEFKEGLIQNNFPFLLHLLTIRSEVHTKFHYLLPVQDSWPRFPELLNNIQLGEELETFKERIKELGYLETQIRRLQIKVVFSRLKEKERAYSIYPIRLSKVYFTLHFVNEEYDEAYRIQKYIYSLIEQGNRREQMGLLIRELSILIRTALLVDDFESVVNNTFRYSKLNPKTQHLIYTKEKYWIKDLAYVAENYSDCDLGKQAFKELVFSDNPLIENSEKINLYFFLGKVAFQNSDFKLAERIWGKFSELKKTNSSIAKTYADFIQLISLYEIDDFDRFDDLFHSIKRSCQYQGNDYGEWILNRLQKYINTPLGERKDYLKCILKEFDNYKNSMAGMIDFKYFDFSYWIRAKLSGKKISVLVREDASKRTQRMEAVNL